MTVSGLGGLGAVLVATLAKTSTAVEDAETVGIYRKKIKTLSPSIKLFKIRGKGLIQGRHLIFRFLAYSLKIDTPESIIVFIRLFCFVFSPKNLVRLFPLKKVKPSPDVFATRTLFLKFVAE